MRRLLANTFHRLGNWLQPKAVPQPLTGQQWSGTQYFDAYKRNRESTPNELMVALKNTSWSCATASNPGETCSVESTGPKPRKATP